MSECTCGEYGPLELFRRDINRRIRATRRIRRRLVLVAESDDGQLRLYRCPICGQYWQQSWSWSFGAKDYIYQVPTIGEAEWREEPYARPDEMLVYTAMMDRYEGASDLTPSTSPCRVAGCPRFAVEGLVLCFEHQVESLQRVGLLPTPPQGRRFPPYHVRSNLAPE